MFRRIPRSNRICCEHIHYEHICLNEWCQRSLLSSRRFSRLLTMRENFSPFLTRWENSSPFLAMWEKFSPFLTMGENFSLFLAMRENFSLLLTMREKISHIEELGPAQATKLRLHGRVITTQWPRSSPHDSSWRKPRSFFQSEKVYRRFQVLVVKSVSTQNFLTKTAFCNLSTPTVLESSVEKYK